jgi:hypothetical protein
MLDRSPREADPLLDRKYFERRENMTVLLVERGAREVEHVHGTLFDHLLRTEGLLLAWGCPETVALAGLCHAAYGTDGFPTSLLTLDERGLLANVAGDDVEELVYFYASCDRGFLYPNLVNHSSTFSFRDRFTKEVALATTNQLQDFVDLTLANEFDVGTFGSPSRRPPEWLVKMSNAFGDLASESLRHNLEERLLQLSG